MHVKNAGYIIVVQGQNNSEYSDWAPFKVKVKSLNPSLPFFVFFWQASQLLLSTVVAESIRVLKVFNPSNRKLASALKILRKVFKLQWQEIRVDDWLGLNSLQSTLVQV